jgi:hypothetical protein
MRSMAIRSEFYRTTDELGSSPLALLDYGLRMLTTLRRSSLSGAVLATLVTIGHPGAPVEVDVAAYINKRGITMRGIFGRRLWDTWEQLTLLIESGRIDLSWLITHRLPLTQADHAIELLSADANKILFLPSLR